MPARVRLVPLTQVRCGWMQQRLPVPVPLQQDINAATQPPLMR